MVFYFLSSKKEVEKKDRGQRQLQSKAIAIKDLDYMPENLIIEILSWLPVKDLLKYKSVSKSWYAIISSPDFITKHLKNYYHNNDDWRGCLLVQHHISQAEILLIELFVDETPRVLASEVLNKVPWYRVRVYGPCDGLYLVYYSDEHRALWNPAINQFKPLPSILFYKPDLPSFLIYAGVEVYSFGLDPVSGDYKVVVIKHYRSRDGDSVQHPSSFFVYSLRTNSWRYCGDLAKNYSFNINKGYTYVNGICYWFAIIGPHGNGPRVIISYDLATDAYKEIDAPDYTKPSSMCLAVYDNSLALLSLQENNKIFEIWTWTEEGSWTKKMTSGPFPDIWAPVGHWKDNRLILQRKKGELVLFNPETEEVKGLGSENDTYCDGVFAYMESLVPIEEKEV